MGNFKYHIKKMKQAAVFAIAGTAAAFEVDQTTLHAFDNFVAEHNKMYGTKEEYMFRLKIFSESLQKINDHNEQYPDDAVWGINHMSDWTQKEYQRLLGFKEHVKQPKHEGRRHHRGGQHHGHHDTTVEDTWKTTASTGERKVPSPQLRTKDHSVPAGLSLPPAPWRVPTS